MHFYVLNEFPKGRAETCVSYAKGYVQGDAPRCPKCGGAVGMLDWLPPFRVEIELFGIEFGDFAFGAGNDFLISLRFKELQERAPKFKEVILATNLTTEGEATALYLERVLKPMGIKTSRLGRGLPIGGELEYADEETIKSALDFRR